MDETTLNQIACSIPILGKHFAGVVPKNQIVNLPSAKLPLCFIVNMDKYLEPGSHWIAVFVPTRDEIYYFDSFGIPPEIDPYIMNILKSFNKSTLKYSTVQIQPSLSSNCGLYCIYFLYLAINNYTMENCLNFFKHNYQLHTNDMLIKKLFAEILQRNNISINPI